MAGEMYGFGIKVHDDGSVTIDKINASLLKLQGHAEQAHSQFGGIFKGFVAADIALKGLSMIKEGLESVIKTGAEMEQTHLAFEVLLGSAKKGEELAEKLKAWSDVTPFDVKSVDEAGKMLLNYGVKANQVVPYLKMIGDTSAGNVEKFNQLTYAFGRAASMGHADARIMREMIIAGFNPLQELARTMHTTLDKLPDSVKKAEMPFSKLVELFKSATGEGGRFHGMMQKQSQTVSGLWSTIRAHIQGAEFGIFQKLEPNIKGIELASLGLVKSFEKWVTPKHSEILKDQTHEMNSLFEAISDGNTPTEVRKQLIEELNSKFKDYIPNLVKEKDTLQDIAEKQKEANKELNANIKTEVHREIYQEQQMALQNAIDSEKKWTKIYEDFSHKRIDWRGVIAQAGPMGWLQSKIGISDPAKDFRFAESVILGNVKLATQREAEHRRKLLDIYKEYGDIKDILGGADLTAPTIPSEMEMGASGGLGTAKQINIKVDKFLNVETKSMGTMTEPDLKRVAEEAIDLLTREVHNQMVGAGEM